MVCDNLSFDSFVSTIKNLPLQWVKEMILKNIDSPVDLSIFRNEEKFPTLKIVDVTGEKLCCVKFT